jgi:hypothetical protein
MTKTRYAQIIGTLLLGWYTSTSLPASAQILPDPGRGPGPVPAPAPAAIVVHQHVSLWTYALVAALAVLVTLAVLAALRWSRRVRLSPAAQS